MNSTATSRQWPSEDRLGWLPYGFPGLRGWARVGCSLPLSPISFDSRGLRPDDILRDQASSTLEGEIGPEPAHGHQKAVVEADQQIDVGDPPDEPGDEALELEAAPMHHRRVAADHRQIAAAVEAERRCAGSAGRSRPATTRRWQSGTAGAGTGGNCGGRSPSRAGECRPECAPGIGLRTRRRRSQRDEPDLGSTLPRRQEVLDCSSLPLGRSILAFERGKRRERGNGPSCPQVAGPKPERLRSVLKLRRNG
jgi:hypothetical protein